MQHFLITYSSEDKAGGVDSAHARECELYGHNPGLAFSPGSNLCKCWDASEGGVAQGLDSLPNALYFANRLVIVALFSCLACNDERSATDVHPYNQNFVEEERVWDCRELSENGKYNLPSIIARYVYYEQLLEKKLADIKQAIPKMEKLDKDGLAKLKFESAEPSVLPSDIDFDFSQSPDQEGGMAITKHDAEELSKQEIAHGIQIGIHIEKTLATALKPIPDAKLALHFWGIGGDLGNLPGGTMLAELANLAADIASAVADQFSYQAMRAGKVGAFATCQRDYQFQSNAAPGEITRLFKQLRAAQIREAIAARELDENQPLKTANSVASVVSTGTWSGGK